MPLFENCCTECGKVIEWYAHTRTTPDPVCCGKSTERMMSRFGIVWTGTITSKYNDPKLENAHMDGHWATRVRSSISGKPESVYIDTWQKQREFCKQEGLVNPRDVGPVEIGADGKSISSRGLPGCEV